MPRERPLVVLVLAVLNFVLGALVLLWALPRVLLGIFLLFVFPLLPAPMAGGVQLLESFEAMRAVPGYIVYVVVCNSLDALMAVVLIVSGFGLLRLRPWGRRAALAFAVYAIPAVIASNAYFYTVFRPAMAAWVEDFRQRMPPGTPVMDPGTPSVLRAVFPCIVIAYAVALLVVLFLPRIAAAFRPDPAGGADRSAGEKDAAPQPARRASGEDE